MSIIIFLIVLSLLILIHEFGHFYTAKKLGVWVEEFGLGIPPKAWGKKIGETIYSLNWLPFGGFVRLHGENLDDTVSKPDKAFSNKSKKSRALIVSAGVIMNFLLAVVAFGIVYSFTGVPKESDQVSVISITEGSPASDAGILEGDKILEVAGTPVHTTQEFISEIAENLDSETPLVILRDGTNQSVSITPRSDHPEDQGPVGVVISSTENYFPPLLLRPFYGVYYGFKEAIFWMMLIIAGFISMIQTLLTGQVPAGVSGPVGIYALTTQAASFGLLALINFMGILSLNLAIINILPIPALDGGRLFFIVLESVFGRKVLPRVENYLHLGGFVILIFLIVLITVSDVSKLITAGGISGFLESFGAP